MNRPAVRNLAVATLALAGSPGIGAQTAGASRSCGAEGEPLNLVVVMADQWRGQALGFMGREPVLTPNLDRFASRSVVVGQCVSGYPVSSPARAMFLTGVYPAGNGVTANCNSRTAPYGVELRQDLPAWSDVLKAKGYATGYIGKWHLDAPYEPYIDCSNNKGPVAWNEWCPPERRHGFDYWVAYGTYDRHLRPLYWHNATRRDDWRYVDCWGPEYEAGLAVDFIRGHAGKGPFALMVSMNPPHPGYSHVPQRYRDMYAGLDADSVAATYPGIDPGQVGSMPNVLRDYYACMTGVDEQFGRIVEELERQGLMEKTLVVFTSDHGDMMGIHGLVGKNTFYEEAVRVPMIVGGAGLKPRRDDRLLMSLEDFTPTILGLMGYGGAIPATVQTRDLSRQICGRMSGMPEGQLYIRMWSNGNSGAGFEGAGPDADTDGWRGWRDGRYTYAVRWQGGKVAEEYLFDRREDPRQLHNAVRKRPGIARRMRTALYARLREIGDPMAASLETPSK